MRSLLVAILAVSSLSFSAVAMAKTNSNVECEAKKESHAANLAPQKSERIISSLLDDRVRTQSPAQQSGTATR